jgi:hypothetical protein
MVRVRGADEVVVANAASVPRAAEKRRDAVGVGFRRLAGGLCRFDDLFAVLVSTPRLRA